MRISIPPGISQEKVSGAQDECMRANAHADNLQLRMPALGAVSLFDPKAALAHFTLHGFHNVRPRRQAAH